MSLFVSVSISLSCNQHLCQTLQLAWRFPRSVLGSAEILSYERLWAKSAENLNLGGSSVKKNPPTDTIFSQTHIAGQALEEKETCRLHKKSSNVAITQAGRSWAIYYFAWLPVRLSPSLFFGVLQWRRHVTLPSAVFNILWLNERFSLEKMWTKYFHTYVWNCTVPTCSGTSTVYTWKLFVWISVNKSLFLPGPCDWGLQEKWINEGINKILSSV